MDKRKEQATHELPWRARYGAIGEAWDTMASKLGLAGVLQTEEEILCETIDEDHFFFKDGKNVETVKESLSKISEVTPKDLLHGFQASREC